MMDDNWGWLSTYFLNRTAYYGTRLDGSNVQDPYSVEYKTPIQQAESFLDDPNLVMLLVNQHHNVSF